MATDVFTGTDGTALPTYSANWSYVAGTGADHEIQSNAVASNSSSDIASRSNHQSYGNDQFSQAVISGVATGQYRGVIVRAGANGSNNYYGFAADDVSCFMFRYESGTFTQIGSTGSGGIANGQLIRLEVEGTTLRPFINGSQTGTPGNQTDTTYASGVPGIFTSGANLTFLIDTWEGNALAAVTVDSVTPSTFEDAETGIVISCAGAEASQGTGDVVISPIDNIAGEPTIAPSFVANALGGTTTTTSFSITLPTTQAGDLILLEFCHRGTADGTIGGTYTGGAFSQKHSQLFASSVFSGKMLWSRATGNHAGETVTGSGLTDSCAAIVTVYRNVIGSGDPFDGAATIVGEENASGNETQAQITTLAANCLVCLTVLNSPDLAVATQASTDPATLTERAERLSTGGTDSSISHASAVRTAAGATGALTWTQTNAASGSYAYALQPRAPLGAAVDQTVTAWADAEITFTADQNALPSGVNLYLFVRNNSGGSNGAGEVVQFEAAGGVTGTGAINASAPTAAGAGTRGVEETTANVNATVPTAAGTGVRGITGTGDINASVPVVAGVGAAGEPGAHTGSGNVPASVPTAAGVGSRVSVALGSPDNINAPMPVVAGTGTVASDQPEAITGSGIITGTFPTILGAGRRGVRGTGAITASRPTIAGVAIHRGAGIGAINASMPFVTGVGVRRITGTGAITAARPQIFGSGAGVGEGGDDGVLRSPVRRALRQPLRSPLRQPHE